MNYKSANICAVCGLLSMVNGVEWRRPVCLTNGRSAGVKHHTAMQTIFVAWYNFARKNEALKGQARAMASGLSGHVWTIKELIERAADA